MEESAGDEDPDGVSEVQADKANAPSTSMKAVTFLAVCKGDFLSIFNTSLSLLSKERNKKERKKLIG